MGSCFLCPCPHSCPTGLLQFWCSVHYKKRMLYLGTMPVICPWPGFSGQPIFHIFVKFSVGALWKMLSSKLELCENQFSDSHALLKGQINLYPSFLCFFTNLGANGCRGCPQKCVECNFCENRHSEIHTLRMSVSVLKPIPLVTFTWKSYLNAAWKTQIR